MVVILTMKQGRVLGYSPHFFARRRIQHPYLGQLYTCMEQECDCSLKVLRSNECTYRTLDLMSEPRFSLICVTLY